MKRGQEKLLSHILMVAAPLLALLMITVAWFVNAHTIGMSEMSFAAQNSGFGATLYPSKELTGRNYDKDNGVLTHEGIIWGAKLLPEESDITIKDMLPGQCQFYLLASDKAFTPALTGVTITDADGKDLENDAVPTDLLPQCLGLYLIPTEIDLTADPLVSGKVDIFFTGADKTDAAFFKDGASSAQFPEILPENASKAYILAVFCDPVLGQSGPEHIATLPGSISFSLVFNTVGGS